MSKRDETIPLTATTVIRALLESLKAHDPYTYGHCRRVGRNSGLLAEAAGLNPFQVRVAEFSGLLHDIGKIGIPADILRKEGKLAGEEEQIMRSHVERSVQIVMPLTEIPLFRALIPGIRYHHERLDGKGYPYGLKGDEVPLEARIVTIADTVDAMTTHRPYRQGKPMSVAYAELQRCAGTQFDPRLVEVFLKYHPGWEEFEEEITESFISRGVKKAG